EGERPAPVRIDFDAVDRRVVALPVPHGRYAAVRGLPESVLVHGVPLSGPVAEGPEDRRRIVEGTVTLVELATGEITEDYLSPVDETSTDPSGAFLLYRHEHRIRVVPAGVAKSEVEDYDNVISPPGRETGWVDLARVTVPFHPAAEWRQ